MNQAEIVEIELRVALVALLIDGICLTAIVSFLAVNASSVSLQNSSVFFVDPERLDALVDGVSFDKAPSLEMSKHSQMLSHCRNINFFLKVDHISVEAPFVVKRLGDKGLSFPRRAPRVQETEHRFIRVEQHKHFV